MFKIINNKIQFKKILQNNLVGYMFTTRAFLQEISSQYERSQEEFEKSQKVSLTGKNRRRHPSIFIYYV